jgi:uncharacterized protein (TIGR02996 family)
MSDETAFLDALRAAPNDTTARVVYADWLDERGDAARAEFLRLAVLTSIASDASDAELARRERLRQLAVGLDTMWLAAATGLRVATVEVDLPFAHGATVTFADSLEVSLDCCVCRRCHRTVVFQGDGTDGRCTPTRHSFPGYMLRNDERDGRAASVHYLVAYRYESFVDAKYADFRRPSGVPTWGRVYFTILCPVCGECGTHSVQTNAIRPREPRCKCGTVLFREERETPVLACVDERTKLPNEDG